MGRDQQPSKRCSGKAQCGEERKLQMQKEEKEETRLVNQRKTVKPYMEKQELPKAVRISSCIYSI